MNPNGVAVCHSYFFNIVLATNPPPQCLPSFSPACTTFRRGAPLTLPQTIIMLLKVQKTVRSAGKLVKSSLARGYLPPYLTVLALNLLFKPFTLLAISKTSVPFHKAKINRIFLHQSFYRGRIPATEDGGALWN